MINPKERYYLLSSKFPTKVIKDGYKEGIKIKFKFKLKDKSYKGSYKHLKLN